MDTSALLGLFCPLVTVPGRSLPDPGSSLARKLPGPLEARSSGPGGGVGWGGFKNGSDQQDYVYLYFLLVVVQSLSCV